MEMLSAQVGTPQRGTGVLRDIRNVTPNGGTPTLKKPASKTPMKHQSHPSAGPQRNKASAVDDPRLQALLQMQNKKATQGIVLEREGVHTADVLSGQQDASASVLPLTRQDSISSSPVDLGDGGTAIDSDLRAKLERQNKRSAKGIVLQREGVHTADAQCGHAHAAAPRVGEEAPTASSSPVDLGAGDIPIEDDLRAKLERQNKRSARGIVLTRDGEDFGLPHYEASKYEAPPPKAVEHPTATSQPPQQAPSHHPRNLFRKEGQAQESEGPMEERLKSLLKVQERKAQHGLVLTRDGAASGLPHYEHGRTQTRAPTHFSASMVEAPPTAPPPHAVSIQPVLYVPPACVDTPKGRQVRKTPQKFDPRRAIAAQVRAANANAASSSANAPQQPALNPAAAGATSLSTAQPTPIKKISHRVTDLTPIKRIDVSGPDDEGSPMIRKVDAAPPPGAAHAAASVGPRGEAVASWRSAEEETPAFSTPPVKVQKRAASTGKRAAVRKREKEEGDGSPDLGDGGRLVDAELKQALKRQHRRANHGAVASPHGGWSRLGLRDEEQAEDEGSQDESVNLGEGGLALAQDLRAKLRRQHLRANQGIVLRSQPLPSALPRYHASSRRPTPSRLECPAPSVDAARALNLKPKPAAGSNTPAVARSAAPPEPAHSPGVFLAQAAKPQAATPPAVPEPEPVRTEPLDAAAPGPERRGLEWQVEAAGADVVPPPQPSLSPTLAGSVGRPSSQGGGAAAAEGPRSKSGLSLRESRDLAEAYIRQLHMDPHVITPRQMGGGARAGGVEARASSVQWLLWEALVKSQPESLPPSAAPSLMSISAASSRQGSLRQPKPVLAATQELDGGAAELDLSHGSSISVVSAASQTELSAMTSGFRGALLLSAAHVGGVALDWSVLAEAGSPATLHNLKPGPDTGSNWKRAVDSPDAYFYQSGSGAEGGSGSNLNFQDGPARGSSDTGSERASTSLSASPAKKRKASPSLAEGHSSAGSAVGAVTGTTGSVGGWMGGLPAALEVDWAPEELGLVKEAHGMQCAFC